jgi:DNA topoisomerase-1
MPKTASKKERGLSLGHDLVIVESPAKARTITKYLGGGYRVKATVGHMRDLPKNELGVDPAKNFAMKYTPIDEKAQLIRELKAEAAEANRVLLATDPDREGEAISWHVKELLGLPDERALRVTFHEITQNAVRKAIDNPRAIDQDLVDAQQARRAVDRLVGYVLSPLLWKKIRSGLSAGRVQSVATRMVVDREAEIRAFIPEEYWHLDAEFQRIEAAGRFTARFHGTDDGKKRKLVCQADVEAVAAAVKGQPANVSSVKETHPKRSPAPPFITSSFQQEASRRFGMGGRRAMAVAQQLYEGVAIAGYGVTGLITYMRTDSLRLADEAVQAARSVIAERYGPAMVPDEPRVYKSRGGAQDAHEAIRPTMADLTPEKVKDDLQREQYLLYKMIWERFIACQMIDAVYHKLTIDVSAAGYLFRAVNTTPHVLGFTQVYVEGRDVADEEPEDTPLPDLRLHEPLNIGECKPGQKFTEPPPRYTEASLVRAMEENGVGRPSTYAPTIATIQERMYTVREGKQLKPTPLGEVVTNFMKDQFSEVVDLAFTAGMEALLDQVEAGNKPWKEMVGEFYGPFSEKIRGFDQTGERIRVPDEPTGLTCELCGREMVKKMSRFGFFLSCSGYPECKHAAPIVEEMPGSCPACGAKILKKKSKKGYTFYACEKGSDCSFITWDTPVEERCELCSQTLFKKSGKGRTKPFCVNAACKNFLPEDKRGYKKKEAEAGRDAPSAPLQKPTKTTRAAPGAPRPAPKRAKK